MKFKLICGLGAVAVLAITGCKGGGGSDNEAVATIGKTQVTKKEFYDYLQRKPEFLTSFQGQIVPMKVNYTPGFQALQDLIENKVVEEIAKEKNVFPTDSQVQAELEMQLKQDPHLVEKSLAAGYSTEELKVEFKDLLCRFNIETKGVTVTKQEVDDFIKQNPKNLMEPPRVDAQMIVVKTAADEKNVDDALRSGQPFTTVAQEYSQQKDPKGRYAFPESDESKMAPAMRALFDKTPELKTTDWQPVSKTGGFIKIYVAKKVPEKPIEVTDFIRESIKRSLMQRKGAAAGISLDKLLAEKLQADKDAIKINIKQDEDAWKQFQVQIGEKLAASSTQPVGTTPGVPAPGVTVPPATPTK